MLRALALLTMLGLAQPASAQSCPRGGCPAPVTPSPQYVVVVLVPDYVQADRYDYCQPQRRGFFRLFRGGGCCR